MGRLSKNIRAKLATIKDVKKLDYSPQSNGVIVSFTTVPSRIKYIKPTVVSLLRQTCKPDHIELNLGKVPRKADIPWQVPAWLENLDAVKIFWIDPDLGPATKFIPTLQRHRDDEILIIVVDDDMLYPRDLVEAFVISDRDFKRDAVFCSSGHLIPRNLVFFDSPRKRRVKKGKKRVAIIEGCGGYCLRPGFLDIDELAKEDSAPEGALTMDDIWISGHLSRRNIQKYQIPAGKRKSLPQTITPAIVGPRAEISDGLLEYFGADWEESEYAK